MENNEEVTIEKLAQISQKEFITLEKKMDDGFNELKQMVGSVLHIVENIEGRMGEVHTVGRVDMPDLRDRVEILEGDMKNVKEKILI